MPKKDFTEEEYRLAVDYVCCLQILAHCPEHTDRLKCMPHWLEPCEKLAIEFKIDKKHRATFVTRLAFDAWQEFEKILQRTQSCS